MSKINHNKVKMVIIFVLVVMLSVFYMILTSMDCNAQSGFYQGDDKDFSLGQTFFTTTEGSLYIENQGMIQTFVPDTTPTAVDMSLLNSLNVYPNPMTNVLTIESQDELDYEVYDIYGKLLRNGKTNSDISVKDLVPAPYFLRLKQNELTIKTFKLIKQ